MAQAESPLTDQIFFIYAIMVFAILIGGLYITTSMKHENKIEVMQKIITDNRLSNKALNTANDTIQKLPPNPDIRFFVSLAILKAFAFVQVAPILIFSIFIAMIDVSIKKSSPFYSSLPSVTTYHDAKRMFPAFLIHMPLVYITMPIESFIEFNAQAVKFSMASANSFLLYHRLRDLLENKPSKM